MNLQSSAELVDTNGRIGKMNKEVIFENEYVEVWVNRDLDDDPNQLCIISDKSNDTVWATGFTSNEALELAAAMVDKWERTSDRV